MSKSASRTLPCLAWLLLGAIGARPALPPAPGLGTRVPGHAHLGALLDVAALGRGFPRLARHGRLAAGLDALVAAGHPDPRQVLSRAGLALDLVEGRPAHGVLVGQDGPALGPAVRTWAARLGLGLGESAYRGVLFLTPELPGHPATVADLLPGSPLVGYAADGTHRLARAAVDATLGLAPSFAGVHGLDLDGDRYLVAGLRLPLGAARELAAGIGLPPAAYAARAAVVLARAGADGARLGLDAECRSTLEARLMKLGLEKARDRAAAATEDPELRAWIEAITVTRTGKVVTVALDLPRAALDRVLVEVLGA